MTRKSICILGLTLTSLLWAACQTSPGLRKPLPNEALEISALGKADEDAENLPQTDAELLQADEVQALLAEVAQSKLPPQFPAWSKGLLRVRTSLPLDGPASPEENLLVTRRKARDRVLEEAARRLSPLEGATGFSILAWSRQNRREARQFEALLAALMRYREELDPSSDSYYLEAELPLEPVALFVFGQKSQEAEKPVTAAERLHNMGVHPDPVRLSALENARERAALALRQRLGGYPLNEKYYVEGLVRESNEARQAVELAMDRLEIVGIRYLQPELCEVTVRLSLKELRPRLVELADQLAAQAGNRP